jgi:hypothetical protein
MRGRSQLFGVSRAARRLVVAALVTGGLLAGGTTAVAAGQRTITAPSHTRIAEGNRPIARVPGAFGTTIAVGRFADVSSTNWAGLAENGTTYTGVSASWTVPTVLPSIPRQVSSSWIGIDGYSNSNLIQTGTEEDTSGGATSYYAWWEILPAAETPIFTVSPGDQMSADIFKVSATTWTIDITDNTSGQNFSQNKSYSGPANSAEWIQEMTGTSPQAPLANFGTANFTSLNFTAANPAANTPTLIRMVNSSNHTIAYPTVPGASDLTVTYGQPSTQTTPVTASPSPAALGTSVIYSATVAATGGVITPTGSVTFSTGSTSLCSATLSSGSGSCSSSAAPIGTDTVFATYSGGIGLSASTGSTTLTITKAPSQTSITAVGSSGTLGSPVVYSANVTASATGLPTPTGSVTFTTGSTTLCTATLSNGGGSCTSAAAPVGTDTIQGAYAGDANFSASSVTTSLVVDPALTQTLVDASPSPAALGSSVTYSTTVTTNVTGLPTPTGSVTFSTGSTTLCTATLANGIGSCSSSAASPVGTDTISGAYSGDANFSGSFGTTSLVVEEPSQTAIGVSSSPVTVGTSVTYSATVATNVTGQPTPTGSVTFSTGSMQLCVATLASDGTGSCSSTAAPVGNDTISGAYSGDAVFTDSTGTTSLVVSKALSQTAIGSLSPVTVGTSVTYSATVTPTITGFPSSGSVTFSVGATQLCTANLSNGNASCGSSAAPVGTDTITGTYSGDGSFVGSSGTTTLAVSKSPSQTAIGSLSPVTVGTSVTFSATVTPNITGFSLSGSVTFSTGSTSLCTATLFNGSGSCASSAAPAGSDAISGTYAGNGSFSSSTGTTTLVVNDPPPPPPPPPTHGYWLVGSDGGIFTFGSAQFYGSTGSLRLQRPVVGIVPTADRGGYWLDASDGGVFAFGDSGFYGSIPGLGLRPADSGLPNSLNAPIVGMVPSADGHGYFMVASDGGVFAFGDARFAGSCPGIGGCNGAAVAVMPDASGNGYWLVTQSGHVYTFGDAPYYGAPGPRSTPVTSAVRTPDGRGYWILFADGTIAAYGDAGNFGSPAGQMGGLNPAGAIFTTADGSGYWVAAANGAVANYGDAPNDGSMLGTALNGSIIAATGW